VQHDQSLFYLFSARTMSNPDRRAYDEWGNDLPTVEDDIAGTRRDMDRIRMAQNLRRKGYAVTGRAETESARVIDLGLRLDKLEREKATYWDSHDM
jgi:hypothetical protein